MARPNKLHKDKRGQWRSNINGETKYFGKDRARALRRFHQALADAGQEIRPSTNAPRTIDGLIAAWLEVMDTDDADYRTRTFVDWAGAVLLAELDESILIRFERHLTRKPVPTPRGPVRLARKSINDRVWAAAAALRWAKDEQHWHNIEIKVPSMPKPVRRPKDIDPSALAEGLASLPIRAGMLLRFAAATGCRPKEARLLKWSDVSLRTGTCVLGKHKTADQTGEPRTIYLTPPARAILEGMESHEGWVFPSRLGRPYTAAGLRSILQRCVDGKRRVEGTVYGLRHTFAQVGSEQLNEQDLGKLMGHNDPATTRLYYRVRDARAALLANRLSLPQLQPAPTGSPPAKGVAPTATRPPAPSPRRASGKERASAKPARRRA